MQEGLPEQTVQSLVQTTDGYLWVGTSGGLARFDGANFRLFNNADSPAFRSNSVYALLASADGSLWIGTEGGGLLRYRGGSFRTLGQPEGLTDPFVRSLLEESPGVLLVGTNNGFFRFAGGRFTRLDGRDGLPAMAVNAMALSPRGDLWVGGSRLLVRAAGQWRTVRLPGEASRNRVKSLLVTPDGAVWVGTVSGLFRSPDGNQPFVAVQGCHGTVRVLRLGSGGMIWMSIVGQGGFGFRLLPSAPFLSPRVTLNNTVLSFLEDGEQDIWVGTQSGLVRLTPTQTSVVPLRDARDSDFGTVYADADGALWATSVHLARFASGHIETSPFPDFERRGIKIRNVLRDHRGDLWLGTEGAGLWVLHDGGWRQFTTADGLPNNFLRVLLEGRDHSLWIGTDEGVSHWVHGRFINYGLPQGLAYFSVRSMLEDRRGDVWIGTEQGLSRWHRGTLVRDDVTRALEHERVWAIHEDDAGGLWFGTRDDGLYHLRDARLTHWTKRDGLANNAVYSMVEDNAGRLWMAGSQTVVMMRRADLEGTPQPHHPPQVSVFYPSSGPGTQMFGGMQPSAALDAEGTVWFPSNEGLVRVSPQPARVLPLPRLVVDHASIDGRQLEGGNAVVIRPGTSRLQIGYTPLMLRPQSHMRFRYQLQGFDSDWTEAGSQHNAEYTNLPPGHYRFVVQGYEMDRPDRLAEASLAVTQLPAFYMTWWFRVACLAGVLGLVLLVHWLRVRRLRAQFDAVLEERSRLAREMHDTLIQGCTSVSVALEATARSRASQAKPLEPLLELARTQIVSTLQESRAAVLNLRAGGIDAQDTVSGLTEQIQRMCEQMQGEFGVPVRCRTEGDPLVCTQTARHEVLMIVREALHNAVLHGRPSGVDLTLGRTRRDCTIEIHDDGAGFDPQATMHNQSGHFGVVGMRERATRMGGQLSIQSAIGVGTVVTMRIPSRKLMKEHRHG